MTFTTIFLSIAIAFFVYWIYKAIILLRTPPRELKLGLQLGLQPENNSIKKVSDVNIDNAVKIMVESKFSKN